MFYANIAYFYQTEEAVGLRAARSDPTLVSYLECDL